jgi:UPF0271 protein
VLAEAGAAEGLQVALEIFADRTYEDDASLTPRSQNGAVLHGAAECGDHVARMLEAGGVVTRSGKCLATPIHSICVHGDGPDAVAVALSLKEVLARHYILAPLAALSA